jgi:hypothetical protein
MAFVPIPRTRHPLPMLTTRQASLHAADRSVASPKGLLTLGSDTGPFAPIPPACYRASWQLPGPDPHRQATTSFMMNSSTSHSFTSIKLGARN